MALVINSNANDVTDGSAHNMLQRINCHTPIVIITRTDDFVFNEELLGLDKYVIADFSEHGWDAAFSNGTPLFGKNFEYYKDHFKGDGYKKFNQFVSDRQPLLYMKRELLKRDATNFYQPIEYCGWFNVPFLSEEEFNAKPLEVFFNWGLSNPVRPKLHGNIWSGSHQLGYTVGDNIQNLSKFLKEESNPRKWLTVNTPHYARYDVKEIISINSMAKLSVCMWGAGRKCFRTTGESPLNAAMILPEDDMAYQYEWKSGFNCIKIQQNELIIDAINEATKRKDLYEVYKNGYATSEKYRVDNYTNHLAEIINAL